MSADNQSYAVPLLELLRSVPRSARLEISEHPFSTRFIPVGRYCHEAADALASPTPAEPAQQDTKGWQLVPVEPDGRMWSVGRAEFIRAAQQYEDVRSADKASIVADVSGSDIYRAMLRAAPQSPSVQHAATEPKALRGDTKRLDAIIRNMWFVEPQYDSGEWRVGKADANGHAAHKGKTLREAIDAALAADQKGENDVG